MDVGTWMILSVLLAILYLIYKHLTRNFDHWKKLHVPYLQPTIVFGNIFNVITFKQSLGQFVKDAYEYTDSAITGFFVFDQPFLLVRDPDLIKLILIKDFEHFTDRSVIENRPHDEIASNLLFIINNPPWKEVRIKLTPVFSTGKLKGMFNLFLEVRDELQEYIENKIVSGNSVIDSRELAMKYTTDVISSCAFGINSHSFKYENGDFRVATRRFFKFTISRSIQIGSYFIAPCLAKLFGFKFLEKSSSEFMCSVFWKHMNQRSASGIKRGDLIDLLLQIKESTKNNLPDDVIVAQAMQFFLAGFETTGNVISFALYELALNKDMQNRLREEIRTVMELHGELSYENIMEMKYLDCVLSETLRIYPPLTFLDRRCTKKYKIPGTDVTIEKGIPIYISLFGLHMDEKYFPEPNKFDPDRFSDDNRKSILPYTYMPFGDGPRNCIGTRFAHIGARIAISTVLLHFEVDCCSETPVPMVLDTKSGFLISPKDGLLPLNFKRLT